METNFFSRSELDALPLGSCGEEVLISRNALILAPESVHVGAHSRIDAFCLISGNPAGVAIGSFVHLSAYVSVLGAQRTTIEDYVTVSARCSLFTSNDDYTGKSMCNPTIPPEYREVTDGPIVLRKHCIIGCNSVILPNVTIGLSAAVGALTLVKHDVEDFAVVAGVPMRRLGTRQSTHLEKATLFRRTSTIEY